ncbi:hypothetical protein RQP46_002325 [Phenoliferia psychrophenolica]
MTPQQTDTYLFDGKWVLLCDRRIGRFSIEWREVKPEVEALVKELVLSIGVSTTQLFPLSAWPGGPSGSLHQSSLKWTFKSESGNTFYLRAISTYLPSLPVAHGGLEQALIESAAESLTAPQPNDVEFIFPRANGRSLWGSSTILSRASPYLATLLESGFAETDKGEEYAAADTGMSSFGPLPCEESDDEPETEAPSSESASRRLNFPHSRIKVTETSFKTYHAVLFWIYTGQITFTATPPSINIPRLPLPASPKAVYRLAHLLDLPKLQALALSALFATLNPSNILTEITSETSGTYDDVLDVLVKFLMK